MKYLYRLTSCCLLVFFFFSFAQAQEKETAQKFVVFEEMVFPSKWVKYAELQDKVIELWNKHEIDIPVHAYRTNDYGIFWVVPLDNFASLDKLYDDMNGVWAKMKEEDGFDASKEFRDLATGKQTTIMHLPKLSYHKGGEVMSLKDAPYCEWTFVYLKAGHEKEIAKAVMDYQKFYDEIPETYHWDVYAVTLGDNTPCWILMSRAENEIAMREHDKMLYEKYGEKFTELWGAFISHVREVENRRGWYVPKWSSGSK